MAVGSADQIVQIIDKSFRRIDSGRWKMYTVKRVNLQIGGL